MDQDWQVGDQLIEVDDEPSFPRKQEPRASDKPVALDPRFRGGDAEGGTSNGSLSRRGDAAALDWATVQALTFTANGLAG